ncbi:MAG: hypothetical protein IKF71_04890 [Bacilli bacterium]|nr:hypothetical protein [Bacilli bacterium]MBR3211250.1 hypothetical protein [Bacilli bacterium]
MKKRIDYFLIARCRETNKFQIIPINGKRENSLEEIDIYTIGFKNEGALEKSLQEEGLLKDSNIDFFIACQGKVNEETVLKIQEVLYAKVDAIKDITENSLRGEMDKSQFQIDYILDNFASRMAYNPVLREQVISGKTNIYKKFIKYFISSDQTREGIKFNDGGWARKSYSLIRNVIDAMSRTATKYFMLSDQMYRGLLGEELIRRTSPDYNPQQLVFSEYYDNQEEKDEEKLLEVLTTFETLPLDIFLPNSEMVEFNLEMFKRLSGEAQTIIKSNLTPDLRLRLKSLLSQRDNLKSAVGKSFVRTETSIIANQKDLIKRLKNNPNLLNRAYEWCELYNRYQDKMIGDDHGKEYGKRKQC